MTERTGPLKDLTIVDCTMNLAGPFGTALLADLGADIIKVEPPRGDTTRMAEPLPPDTRRPWVDEPGGVDYGGYFASINRNKRSIVLDLKQAAHAEALLKLCEQADALVENNRAGVMDRLGVGYEAVKARNPRIVYGAIRGFGDPRTGRSPYSDWPAFDIVAQAMGGLAHITGPADGSGFPAGASVGDIYPGTLMALGVVSAIHHARATGQGQFVDVAMMDGIAALCETVIMNYGYNQTSLEPRGQHHPTLMPFGIYPTRDGAVALAVLPPPHWEIFCEVIERPDLVDDPRTKNVKVRKANQAMLDEVIIGWTSQHSKAEVIGLLGGRVPCGPVNTAEDLYRDEHLASRGMLTTFQVPGDNPEVTIMGQPIKMTESPPNFYRTPPMHGEHTEEIAREFGLELPDD